MKFKKGDKVRRKSMYQDDGGWLKGNSILTVRDLSGYNLWFEETAGGWDIDRFELVDTQMTLEDHIAKAKELIGKRVCRGNNSGVVKNWILRQRGESSVIANDYMKDNNLEYCVCLKYGCFETPYNLVELVPDTAELKLNDKYTAKISKGKVEVGCQTFTIEQVREIIELHDKL